MPTDFLDAAALSLLQSRGLEVVQSTQPIAIYHALREQGVADDAILVCGAGGWAIVSWYPLSDSDPAPWCGVRGERYCDDEVTHWRPLPPLPVDR
jgi:hypothetical protein